MMKLIIKLHLTCIFLFGPFLTNGQLNEQEIFNAADSLFAHERFFQAAVEYERIVFEQSDPILVAKARLKKAYSLKQVGEFENAQRGLELINMQYLSDTLTYLVHYEIALCHFLVENYASAKAQFTQMDFFVQDSSLRATSYYLRALNATQLHEYDEAAEYLTKTIDGIDFPQVMRDSLTNEVEALFSKKGRPRLRNPNTAKWLAIFFPGAGHVYAGRPLEGIFNFGIHVAFAAFIAVNFINGNYFTVFTLGTGLLQVFYAGGQKRATYLVDKRNYKRTSKHYLQVLELVKQTVSYDKRENPSIK